MERYNFPLSMSLLGLFCDGDYVNQLPYVWYYVVVKSILKHAREEQSKRMYVFWCLMISVSRPCELLFLLFLLPLGSELW